MRRTRRAISVRFLLISVAAILGAEALVLALLIKPPHDGEERLLVVADPLCSEALLCEAVVARRGRTGVHVVVPPRLSPLHFLTDDESTEKAEAEHAISITVALLRQRGIPATGSVGTDKIPPDSESYWLERGLLEKARRLTPLPVEQVVVGAQTVVEERAARLDPGLARPYRVRDSGVELNRSIDSGFRAARVEGDAGRLGLRPSMSARGPEEKRRQQAPARRHVARSHLAASPLVVMLVDARVIAADHRSMPVRHG